MGYKLGEIICCDDGEERWESCPMCDLKAWHGVTPAEVREVLREIHDTSKTANCPLGCGQHHERGNHRGHSPDCELRLILARLEVKDE